MAQHVTTLNEIREGMEQTDAPLSSDFVYAERGTGSDRAKAFTVGEIVQHGVEEQLGDGGDIAFSPYQAAGGVTRTKGDIQDGKIVGRMFASVVNLIEKTLQWVNTGFGITELVWNGLRFYKDGSNAPDYLFDNDGIVKLSKLNFNTTIGAQVRNGRTAGDYSTMSDCETKAGSGVKPTEYLSAVYQATLGNDKFTLNSTKHEVGSVVLVTNTGEDSSGVSDGVLKCYLAADTSFTSPVAEIAQFHSKMFRYLGKDASDNPMWFPID